MVFRDLDKKSILENSARVLSTISVVGTDISFTEETNIAEWSYEDYRFVPENGFIGQFTERLLDCKLKELASDINIENAEINLKIGIINGIDNKTTYYDYGNFLITKVGEKDTTGTTSFESADFVKKFNQVYVDTISYPCLALELTNNVCEQVGVELDGNGKAYCIAIDDEGLEQGSYAFLVDNIYYNFNTTKDLNYHDTLMLIKIDNNVRIVQKTVDTITYNIERVDLSYTKTTYRNLLDVSKFVSGRLDNGVIGYTGDSSIDSYDATTGSITYTTTKNWRGIVSDFIPIDSSKTYVGQYKNGTHYNIDYYDSDQHWIQRATGYNWTDGDTSYCVPTIPSNTAYLVINAQASTTGTFSYSNMQFIESNTEQEFIPYESVFGAREVVYNDFTNNDFSIENNQFDEGTLCRDVIKNIAKIGYTWARAGVDNKLHLDFTPKTSSDVDEYNKINTDEYYSEESQLEEYGPVNKVLLGLSNVEGENVYKEQTTDEVSIISINGNTQQDSEPTPTEPVEVSNIKNTVNLFNKEDISGNFNTSVGLELFDDGIKATALSSRTYNYGVIPLSNSDDLLGKTIVLNVESEYSGSNRPAVSMYWCNTTKGILGSAIKGTYYLTYTTPPVLVIPSVYPDNMNAIAVLLYANVTPAMPVGTYIVYHNIGIYEGTIAPEYVDYDMPGVKVLLNNDNLLYTPFTESNPAIITASSADYYNTFGYHAYLEAGKEYHFSMVSDCNNYGSSTTDDTVQAYLMSNRMIGTTQPNIYMTGFDCSFTPTISGSYRLRLDVNKNGSTHSFWNIQITEGPDKKEFVTPIIKECVYNLGDDELCTGDSATIVNGQCKLHKVMRKHTFTGDERITRNTTYNNHYRYIIYSVNDYKPSKDNESIPNIKCDKFVAVTPNQTWGNAVQGKKTGISVPPNNKNGQWFISYESDTTDTIEKFAAWLKANPVTVYYEVETPYNIDLGNQGMLNSFETGYNRLLVNNSLCKIANVTIKDIAQQTTTYSGNPIVFQTHKYKNCQINLYDNPILYTQELRQIALNGCERLFGLRYLPFTTKTIGHPWLEGDDYIQLDNLDGKTLYTYPFDRKLEYKGYIKSDIASTAKTDVEQKYEFESELLSRIVSAEIIVNKAEGVILANTKKMSQLEQGISNANININNLRDSINQTLTDYAKSEDVVQLRQAVETQQTETNLKIEIINEVLEGGISKVKTSKGYTFDDEGLKIADSESEIASKLDNKSFEVRDNTSGHTDTELLYAGIDSKTNESVVRSENLTVRKYCTIGTNSRFEDFEKNNKPGTGVFFIG